MNVRKAVIPVAGLGTRFLPVTRTIPKVMIPVLDVPAVHYSVEEASQAGIEHIVLVISRGQEMVARYFERLPDLEGELEARGRPDLLEAALRVPAMAEVSWVYQDRQLGLGHAVLAAKAQVGDEPFAVFLPDDIIWNDNPTIGSMLEVSRQYGGSVLAVKEVPEEAVSSLGIVDHTPVDGDVSRVVGLVEKPSEGEAPSNLAIIGRYVLTPDVFGALEAVEAGALGEVQLTDAIAALLPTHAVYAYRFPGAHFDVGTPLGMLKASAFAALRRDDLSGGFRSWLQENL